MDKSKIFTATVLVASLSIPTISHSALLGRLAATEGGTDYQAYYDTEADLTWLADANAGAGSVFDIEDLDTVSTDGVMSWQSASDWVSSLNVSGVTGWRLPDTLQPDASCYDQGGASYGCTGSEMGNMYYNVLGGRHHNNNYDLFRNIQAWYWSATEYEPLIANVWLFDMAAGFQGYVNKESPNFAWAVHSGDVSAVPIPSAVFLFGSGLIGLVGLAKRKSNV